MSLTRSISRALTDPALTRSMTDPGAGGGLPNTMVVELASGVLYVRTARDATYDQVWKISVNDVPASATANGCVNPSGIRLIPIATARTGMIAAFNAAVTAQRLSFEGDDGAPVRYNNSFTGGAHAHSVGIKVTSTAHGKTVADLYSEWSDGSKSVWIIAIIDANTLVCMLTNLTASNSAWQFYTNLSAGTLTHITGASNTASFAITTPLTQQLFPGVQDHTKVITINDTTTISADGVYDCYKVNIEEEYGLANPESMRDIGIAGRPWAAALPYNDPSIDTQALVNYDYCVWDNGVMTVAGRFEALQNIGLSTGVGYVGFTQASSVNYVSGASETLNMYIPRVNAIVGSVKTWNFSSSENITGTFEFIDLTAARCANATNWPDYIAQYSKSSGSVNQRGIAFGYVWGSGNDLHTWGNRAGNISASRKMYPYALSPAPSILGSPPNIIPAGTVRTKTAFRAPYSLASLSEATVFAVIPTGLATAEVRAVFHQNVTAKACYVGTKYNGKTVTVLDGNGNLTLDSATVSGGNVTLTVTGSYGEATLSIA